MTGPGGDLASLPAGQTQAKFFFTSIGSDPAGTRGGRFRLTFTGSATVSFSNAGTNVTTIDANTYEFDCDYVGNKWITFTPTSFPIRVSIVKTSDLTAHAAGQYFRQEYLDFIPTGATLRFMDAMLTNSSPMVDWADYPTVSQQTWNFRPNANGAQRPYMPFEVMVDLCNQKSTHPWFCVPHMATDDFVTQMATYIRDNLDSGLKARIELSNEIWNFGINTAGNYFIDQALTQWGTSGGTNWLSAAGKRFVEIMTIFNSVFSGQTHRIIGVLAGQAANPGSSIGMLDAPDWLAADPVNYVAPYTMAKEWAIAPYINWTGSKTARGVDIKAQLDISHAAAVAYIKGMIPDSLAQSKGWIDGQVPLAAARGLRLTMYEYNNHYSLIETDSYPESPVTPYPRGLYTAKNVLVTGALDAFVEATYSAEMADALDDLRDYFKAQNGSLMALFSFPSGASQFGTWGVTRHLGESPDPATHAAWRAWHTANGRWWAQ